MNMNLNRAATELVTPEREGGPYYYKIIEATEEYAILRASDEFQADAVFRHRMPGLLGTSVSKQLLHKLRQSNVTKEQFSVIQTKDGDIMVRFTVSPASDEPYVSFDPHFSDPITTFNELFEHI
jgi:hypothetical protein